MEAVLLNTVNDACHFFETQKDLKPDSVTLLSSNPAVDYYVQHNYGYEVQCISRFATNAEAYDNISRARIFANSLVDTLDSEQRSVIDSIDYLKSTRLYRDLYGYRAYMHHLQYYAFFQVLNALISQYEISRLHYYNNFPDNSLSHPDGIAYIMDSLPCEVMSMPDTSSMASFTRLDSNHSNGIHRIIAACTNDPAAILGRFIKLVKRKLRKYERSGKATILLQGPLYDLSFLEGSLREYNVLFYESFDSSYPMGAEAHKLEPGKLELEAGDALANKLEYSSTDPVESFIYQEIRDDFIHNIGKYLLDIKTVHNLHLEYDIRLGIWGNSPVMGSKRLVFCYLMAQGIPVIGYQHGGMFGNQYNHEVFLSDASHCSIYGTYGFSKHDLAITFPDQEFKCEFIPFGSTKKPIQRRWTVKADILIPITNTIGMLQAGMCRGRPDELLDKQVQILKYFDQLPDLRTIVKPAPYSDYDTLGVLTLLQCCKNIETLFGLTLEEVLQTHKFKAVVLDHASTPLYEVLPYDVDVFIIADGQVRPIEEQALVELKKRVYYAESTEEFITQFEAYRRGELPRKRNDDFYNKHVAREGTEEAIMKLIKSLVK